MNHYRLTVTLTDAPPVRIYTADWPTIVHLPDGHDRWIVIRRHKDGRTLVSAVNRELDPVRRAGQLLPPGTNPADAIRDAADATDLPETLADQAIAALPAESLEDDVRVAVRLTREEWETVSARLWYAQEDALVDKIEDQTEEGKEQAR